MDFTPITLSLRVLTRVSSLNVLINHLFAGHSRWTDITAEQPCFNGDVALRDSPETVVNSVKGATKQPSSYNKTMYRTKLSTPVRQFSL